MVEKPQEEEEGTAMLRRRARGSVIPTEVEFEKPKGREREKNPRGVGRMNPRKHGGDESKQGRAVPTEVELTGRERPKGRERDREGS